MPKGKEEKDQALPVDLSEKDQALFVSLILPRL
jgi:hypothetical protein